MRNYLACKCVCVCECVWVQLIWLFVRYLLLITYFVKSKNLLQMRVLAIDTHCVPCALPDIYIHVCRNYTLCFNRGKYIGYAKSTIKMLNWNSNDYLYNIFRIKPMKNLSKHQLRYGFQINNYLHFPNDRICGSC